MEHGPKDPGPHKGHCQVWHSIGSCELCKLIIFAEIIKHWHGKILSQLSAFQFTVIQEGERMLDCLHPTKARIQFIKKREEDQMSGTSRFFIPLDKWLGRKLSERSLWPFFSGPNQLEDSLNILEVQLLNSTQQGISGQCPHVFLSQLSQEGSTAHAKSIRQTYRNFGVLAKV